MVNLFMRSITPTVWEPLPYSMLHASVCHCFRYPKRDQWRKMSETYSRPCVGF